MAANGWMEILAGLSAEVCRGSYGFLQSQLGNTVRHLFGIFSCKRNYSSHLYPPLLCGRSDSVEGLELSDEILRLTEFLKVLMWRRIAECKERKHWKSNSDFSIHLHYCYK
jgi:hypothetical protein